MKRKPVIDYTRVADGFLFATHGDRCSYLGTSSCYKPQWLKQNAGRFVRIEDIQREAASPAARGESEVNVVAASSGPNHQMSSLGVRKDGGEESNVALVDNPAGDSSPPYQPTSLPPSEIAKDTIAIGDDEYVSAPRLASMLGISERKLERLCANGNGPSHVKIAGNYYRLDKIQEWAAARGLRAITSLDNQ
jgi:hypothetical protein